uniref:hypothetical protein n=1 Tax=Acetatifactor sp. TaxID=1872090 RepID=UPI004055F81A
MDFENKAPEWKAEGVEPAEELKEKGFMAGYKPPAEYFNYLFNRISACISEVQSVVSEITKNIKEHIEDLENPHKVKAKHIGLGNVDNTKDEDKCVKHATTSDTADKANNDSEGNKIAEYYASKEEVKDVTVSDSVTGKNPTAQNSTSAPLIYGKFKGYTEQTQYSGKNKFKPEESGTHWQCTAAVAEDNKITLTNTATSGVAYARVGTFDFKANKTYTISVKDATNLKHYTFFKAGTSESASIAYTSGTATVTPTADIETELIVYMDDISDSGKTTSLYIQIEEDSTATEYEPYVGGTASPNPDYPQEINSLAKDGAIEVKTCGKNIFGGLALAQALVASGSKNVVLDESTKTVEYRHNTNSSDSEKRSLFSEFKENTQYTFILTGVHSDVQTGSASYVTNLSIHYKDGTIKQLTLSDTGAYELVYTSLEDKSIDYLRYGWAEAETNTLYYERCGIFEGVITVEEFTAYEETTASIPIDAPLYEGDYIEVYADGSGKLYKKFMNFNPTTIEGVTTNNVPSAYSKLSKGNCKARATALCNYLTVDASGATTSFNFGNNAEGNFSHVFIRVVGLTTKEEYQTWLDEHSDLEIVYELTTPVEYELTADQVAEFKKLYTFDEVTNVFCDGEVEIQYYKNNGNGEAVSGIQKQVDGIKNSVAN